MTTALARPRDRAQELVADVQAAGSAPGGGRKPLNPMFCGQRQWDLKLACLWDPGGDT